MSLPKPTTLPEKAAQLVFVRLGSNMTPPVSASDDAARVAELLARYPFGGLLLFNGRFPEGTDQLTALQRQSAYPLLVAADIERGVGQQMEGATVFPHAMAFGALEKDAAPAIEALGRITAREALACGIHQLLAPVADVNLHRRNPIISIRAFGTAPEIVARHVHTYVAACRSEGLITTAKHFPGHGRTADDTHDTLPAVEASAAALEATDLVPFRAAIDAAVDTVMTTHAVFPALDPEARPATLSPPILRGLLRERMGFEGPIVTDSLLMAAVRSTHDTPGDQAVALLEAGIDCILDPQDPGAVVDGLVQAVADGRLSAARIDAAFERLWQLKARLADRFGPDVFTQPSRYVPREEVGARTHQAQAASVAARAVTVLEGAPARLSVEGDSSARAPMVVYITPRSGQAGAAAPLRAALRKRAPAVRFHAVDASAEPGELDALVDDAARAAGIAVVLSVTPAAWQPFGLLPPQKRFVAQLADRARRLVAVALGSPHVLDTVPQATARICTYSDVPDAQQALVRHLLGMSS